jgi:hypothetical protein
MYKSKDFEIPNISNLPCGEEKTRKVMDIFGDAYLRYKNIDVQKWGHELDSSINTFRKLINHSRIFGILEKTEEYYHLSEIALDFYYDKISYNEFVNILINENEKINNICNIIIILLRIFSDSLKMETINYIFTILGRNRYDKNALNAVARNLRSIYSLLEALNIIERKQSKIILLKKDNVFNSVGAKPFEQIMKKDIISIKDLDSYVSKYFEKEVVEKVLCCASSFENNKYIWAKSSLYKNNGEILNLYGEYIMTVMRKDVTNE